MTTRAPIRAALALTGALLAASALGQATETFTATASAKTKTGPITAPVRITISRHSTAEERKITADALKTGGTHAVQAAVSTMPDCGTLNVGEKTVPIKYATSRSTGSGRLLTVLTDQPIAHIGSNLPDAKPKTGYDVAVALLILDEKSAGHGEIDMAAKVKMNKSGAIEVEGYSGLKIWLKNIKKIL